MAGSPWRSDSPKSPAHRALEEAEVLDGHAGRRSPSPCGTSRCPRRSRRGQQERGGIAGQVQDEEHHHRDAEQDQQRLPEPAEQVRPHEATRSSRADRLDVRGVREHVDRLHPFEPVAAAHELAEVAGQRGGVARHVDDAAGAERGEGVRAPWDGSPRAADRPPPRPRSRPWRSGRAARSGPRRTTKVQLVIPLARRVAPPRRPPRPGPPRRRNPAARRASSRLIAPVPE